LANRNGKLAVEHEAFDRRFAKRRRHVGKIARQRLSRFRSQFDRLAIAECEAAEAVPFGFELPTLAVRQIVNQPRFHRRGVERNSEAREGRRHGSGNAALHGGVPKRRLTKREPAMPKRHGSSTARVMPMRGPTMMSALPVRGFKRKGGWSRGLPSN